LKIDEYGFPEEFIMADLLYLWKPFFLLHKIVSAHSSPEDKMNWRPELA
jgi:hypothetical protein